MIEKSVQFIGIQARALSFVHLSAPFRDLFSIAKNLEIGTTQFQPSVLL